jgi:hypothetical protein
MPALGLTGTVLIPAGQGYHCLGGRLKLRVSGEWSACLLHRTQCGMDPQAPCMPLAARPVHVTRSSHGVRVHASYSACLQALLVPKGIAPHVHWQWRLALHVHMCTADGEGMGRAGAGCSYRVLLPTVARTNWAPREARLCHDACSD